MLSHLKYQGFILFLSSIFHYFCMWSVFGGEGGGGGGGGGGVKYFDKLKGGGGAKILRSTQGEAKI